MPLKNIIPAFKSVKGALTRSATPANPYDNKPVLRFDVESVLEIASWRLFRDQIKCQSFCKNFHAETLPETLTRADVVKHVQQALIFMKEHNILQDSEIITFQQRVDMCSNFLMKNALEHAEEQGYEHRL